MIKQAHRPSDLFRYTEKSQQMNPVLTAVLEIGALFGIFVAVPLILMLDTNVLGDAMSEDSLTERLQVVLIVISTLIFATGTALHNGLRGYLGAVATLFACMAIRENDSVFDKVYHGFWLIPALVALAVGAVFVWKNRRGAGAGFVRHLSSHSGAFVVLGVLILIVFSRLFGTGAVWEGVMGDAYDPAVKAAVQEGLELLGYFLVTYGSVLSLIAGFGTPVQTQTQP